MSTLKKEYALQLPSSYVDIDREEMEYVDGGLNLAKGPVSFAINAAFNGLLGGGSVGLACTYIRKHGTKVVLNQISKTLTKWISVRVANKLAGKVVSGLTKISGWMNIGDVVVNSWDKFDVKPNNNRLNEIKF